VTTLEDLDRRVTILESYDKAVPKLLRDMEERMIARDRDALDQIDRLRIDVRDLRNGLLEERRYVHERFDRLEAFTTETRALLREVLDRLPPRDIP
jgi:uncharacterized protein YicC (UPF0701 family)